MLTSRASSDGLDEPTMRSRTPDTTFRRCTEFIATLIRLPMPSRRRGIRMKGRRGFPGPEPTAPLVAPNRGPNWGASFGGLVGGTGDQRDRSGVRVAQLVDPADLHPVAGVVLAEQAGQRAG